MIPTNNYDKVHGKGVAVNIVAEPASGRKDDDGKFIKTCPTAVTQDGWTIMTWRGENNGPGGYALTNGVSALLFDENGNIKTSTGKPGDTGCGGKIVRVCTDFLDKGHSYAGQFTGSSQERAKEGKTEELPTYSLHVTGETAIESVGGDVNILGDNVTIQARKILTLKAGTAINIEAGADKDGELSGKINTKCGDYNLDTSFYTENSQKHTVDQKEKGTFTVDQKGSGSKISFNTDGTITSVGTGGDYKIGCGGTFRMYGDKNVQLTSKDGGIGLKCKGKLDEQIKGTRKTVIKCQPGKGGKPDKDGWFIDIAAAKTNGLRIKSGLGLNMKFQGGVNIMKFMGKTTTITAPSTTIKGGKIFLN